MNLTPVTTRKQVKLREINSKWSQHIKWSNLNVQTCWYMSGLVRQFSFDLHSLNPTLKALVSGNFHRRRSPSLMYLRTVSTQSRSLGSKRHATTPSFIPNDASQNQCHSSTKRNVNRLEAQLTLVCCISTSLAEKYSYTAEVLLFSVLRLTMRFPR